ncbi:sensor histidine kinase [Actinomadura decatromicini]|uniref:histidine kinase n=1 Tax=Actinomadura decatromicini TaxID=2604572 RepID=A0A5D3FWL7_9ACTN|nr:histidine kinase [Actinomadura decatromicini]TYK52623.1 histidine kinase [Actinomadura decatromicini]
MNDRPEAAHEATPVVRSADRVKAAVRAVLAPPVRDRVAAVAFAAPATLMMGNHADQGVIRALALAAGVVLFSLPIALGRRRPLLALGLLLTGLCLVGAADPPSTVAGLTALGYVLWPLAAGRYAYAALALAVACAWTTALPDFRHRGGAVVFTLLYLVIWTAGHALGIQRRQARNRAERAATDERLRIAREMHDLLAHGMSVITVQAGYGALIALDQPDKAQAALTTIETTGRQTLTELRALLHVLRPTDTGTDVGLEPAPGLGELQRLVDRTAEAGVRTALELDGPLAGLPPALDLSAYRIAQEALTNVVRHAGIDHAHLLIRRTPDALTVQVTDRGGGAGRGYRPGHGLLGMRERALVHGGTLDAAPLPEGGFRVRAVLPLTA